MTVARVVLHIGGIGSMAPCVLVVDDDRPIRSIVADILIEQGCDVLLASDGEEALGHIRRRPPDLLITDLDMPRLDGLALVHACRSEPDLRQMPIVVITAEADRKARSLAGLGVQQIVAKPFDVHVLITIISSIIGA